MEKTLCVLIALLVLLVAGVGCEGGNYESISTVEIAMPYENEYYEKEEWTVEDLSKEFESLGFTNVVAVKLVDSSDYVYGVVSSVRIDGQMLGWEKGDVFRSTDEVEIFYHAPTPTLTIDNCPELADILNGNTTSWRSFASDHDGEFIEFDGCVIERIDDDAVFSHPIINACGGDYSENMDKQQIRLSYDLAYLELGDHVIYGIVGENYKIIGKIDFSDSKYFNILTIEVALVEYRG